MTEFKIIDGKLCRMVEQPCPHCGQPEIIAERVEDNSHWWALWQMMQGKRVCNPGLAKEKAGCMGISASEFNAYWYRVGDTIVSGINNYGVASIEQWVIASSPSGWEIYTEPKPLLADAKVGDICKRRDGKWVQIDGIDTPCPVTDKYRVANARYDEQGIFSGLDMKLSPNTTLDIIDWEPLAPEGTAEWAWQMMLLGKKVTRKGMIGDNPYYCRKNSVVYCGEDFRSHFQTRLQWLGRDKNWQLYEPEPEPAFKVGDWVEYMGYQCLITAVPVGQPLPDNKTWHAQDILGNECMIYTDNITRKLTPSEVKVKITLEGTVSKITNDGLAFMLWTGCDPHKHAAIIQFDDLDPQAADMVRELVKAQEESCQ